MTRPIRALVVGSVLGQPMGGVWRHNSELLPRLAGRLERDGGSLAVLEGKLPIDFDLPASVERVPCDVPAWPTAVRAIVESPALRRAVDEARAAGRPFDVVHTGHLPTPRGLDVPVTWTVHDLRSIDFGRAPFVRRHIGKHVLGRAVREVARIGVVSRAMAERLAAAFPGSAARIDLVGNGVDHLAVAPRAPAAEPFLLYVGHVEPRKNIEVVVRALALAPDLPPLVVVGAPKGDAQVELETLATELGVTERIRWRGAADDAALVDLFARAHCAVFPSWVEGFGLGVAEARLAGCPTVASDIAAHAEMVAAGVELFDPRAPEALVAALRRTLAAPTGPASPHWEPPTWDAAADRWASLLARAVEHPQG